LRATADGGEDERAVGHVRVIAGVLDHARGCGPLTANRRGEREGRASAAARQRDLDRIGKLAGEQRGIGGLGGCRSAGSCGPAAAKRAFFMRRP